MTAGDGRKRTGRRGEDEACLFLAGRGHTIIERNWRWSHLELDIVSLDPEGIHFVEVKSRTAPALASPEINVNFEKKRRLTRAAAAYLNSERRPDLADFEIFFDIITVVFDGDNTLIEYYPNAFIPLYV